MNIKLLCLLLTFFINLMYLDAVSAACRISGGCISDENKAKLNATNKNLKKTYKKAEEGVNYEINRAEEGVNYEINRAKEGINYEVNRGKEGFNYEQNRAKEGVKYQKKQISNEYNASVRKFKREKRRRQKDFDAQINNIQNKSQASLNRIENQTTNSINDIRRGAQYQSQRTTQRIQASTRKLEEFKRNNTTNHRALSPAFEAAQQSMSTTSKTFGTSTKNAFSRLESSAPAKTVHQWGERASTEKIVKGFNNTVDHIEHSEPARELNRSGKRASMENVRKAVPNTIEYWESSDEGRTLNNLGKRVSVENISKGTDNTINYWESSETGKTIYRAGEAVNDYIDVRATSTDKKVKASMDVGSPGEWLGDKVLGGKAIRHHKATLLRQYGEEHKCERNTMYQKLGYSVQQAAILNYFLYGDDCENIRDTKTVDAFISFFGREFSENLKVNIESNQQLNDQFLEQLFLNSFDSAYKDFFNKRSIDHTAFMLSNLDSDKNSIDYSEMDAGIITPHGIEISEQDAGVIRPRSPKENEPPPRKKPDLPEQPQYSDHTIDPPAPTLREEWQKAELNNLKRDTSSFKSEFKRKFSEPLIEDARTIITMHKKVIDSTTDMALKLGFDEVKEEIEKLFLNVFDGVIKKGIGGALLVNEAINTTFTSYRQENLSYVRKNDVAAKDVPLYFGSGGLGAAYEKSQECGCTVWEGIGGFWYYDDDPNYKIKSRSTRVLRGNSQILSGNNQADNRPKSFVKDVLKNAAFTFTTEIFMDKVKGNLKGRFKEQLKG